MSEPDISTKAIAELAHHFRTLIIPYEGLDEQALADALDAINRRDAERVRAIEDYWGQISSRDATLSRLRAALDVAEGAQRGAIEALANIDAGRVPGKSEIATPSDFKDWAIGIASNELRRQWAAQDEIRKAKG